MATSRLIDALLQDFIEGPAFGFGFRLFDVSDFPLLKTPCRNQGRRPPGEDLIERHRAEIPAIDADINRAGDLASAVDMAK